MPTPNYIFDENNAATTATFSIPNNASTLTGLPLGVNDADEIGVKVVLVGSSSSEGGNGTSVPVDVLTGRNGGVLTNGAEPYVGQFCCIYPLDDTTLATCDGNVTGIVGGGTLPKGIPIYGAFTTVTVTSGRVILYNA